MQSRFRKNTYKISSGASCKIWDFWMGYYSNLKRILCEVQKELKVLKYIEIYIVFIPNSDRIATGHLSKISCGP